MVIPKFPQSPQSRCLVHSPSHCHRPSFTYSPFIYFAMITSCFLVLYSSHYVQPRNCCRITWCNKLDLNLVFAAYGINNTLASHSEVPQHVHCPFRQWPQL